MNLELCPKINKNKNYFASEVTICELMEFTSPYKTIQNKLHYI